MFSVRLDDTGAHFYTNLECTYHFSGFYLKFQYFLSCLWPNRKSLEPKNLAMLV